MPDSLVIDVDIKPATDAADALLTGLELMIARENITTANRAVLEARQRVRVRYGFLAQSIDWVRSKKGDIWIGIARKRSFVIPGTRRFSGRSDKAMPSKYAHLVERGTDHSRAFPFLGPAIKAQKASHEARIMAAMVEAAEDAGLGVKA